METNPLPAPLHETEYAGISNTVYWSDTELNEVVRLRLISDPGHPLWDVSYCFGKLKSGEMVNVDLPFTQLKKGNIKGQIVEFARDENVFAKGLNIFNAISTFV